MDEDLYVQKLIAHYLKQHSLSNTLRAFEVEVNRKFNTESIDESLTVLVKDYLEFQGLENSAEEPNAKSSNASNYTLPIRASTARNATSSINSTFTVEQQRLISERHISIGRWTVGMPEKSAEIDLFGKTLVIFSKIDHVTLDGEVKTVGLFSTSSRSVCVYDLEKQQVLVKEEGLAGRSPVKVMACIPGTGYVLICSMNGNLSISTVQKDVSTGKYRISVTGESIDLHRKLITAVNYHSFEFGSGYFCSLGWDCRLVVCKVANERSEPRLQVIGRITLPTQGTCVAVLEDEELKLPIILVGRVDSSLIHVFTVDRQNEKDDGESIVELAKLSLNDSEFSSHVFHPMAIAESSKGLVSIATNHTPYLRIVTFALPSIREMLEANLGTAFDVDGKDMPTDLHKLGQKQTEGKLDPGVPIIRNIIVSNFNAMTPQDKFSTPVLMPRPAGRNGIWIVGNDGLIRGFDLSNGKVTETIQAHKGRIKTVSAGVLTDRDQKELIVSCGAVDREIFCWNS